jgi:hypothetical protein
MTGSAPVPVPITSRLHFHGISSSIDSGVCPNPLLDRVVHFQGLPQAEPVILPPVIAQPLGNLPFALAASPIPKFRQLLGVPLSFHDRAGHIALPERNRFPAVLAI